MGDKMIIKNAKVLTPEFNLEEKEIYIKEDKFSSEKNGESLDLKNCIIFPGLIDTHIHGAMGFWSDTANREEFSKMSDLLATKGTTSFVPTTMTASIDNLIKTLKRIKEASKIVKGAKIEGVHLEGPFISVEKKGAQDERFIINASDENINALLNSDGGDLIKIITVAPEIEGALSLAEKLSAKNIVVSAGHTNANEEEMEKGINAGFTRMTHTFNAMAPFSHRSPNAIGKALTTNGVVNEIICDFLHVSETAVKLLFGIKNIDDICIISDAIALSGLKDGEYDNFNNSGIYYKKENGIIRLKDGTIAGGSFSMLDGVKNCLNANIDFKKVIAAATKNPAKSLGIYDKVGSIEPNKKADFIVLNENYDLLYTFINGKMVYKA